MRWIALLAHEGQRLQFGVDAPKLQQSQRKFGLQGGLVGLGRQRIHTAKDLPRADPLAFGHERDDRRVPGFHFHQVAHRLFV